MGSVMLCLWLIMWYLVSYKLLFDKFMDSIEKVIKNILFYLAKM